MRTPAYIGSGTVTLPPPGWPEPDLDALGRGLTVDDRCSGNASHYRGKRLGASGIFSGGGARLLTAE